VATPADAFGRALDDWVRGGTIPESIERDDGFGEAGAGPEVYLAGVRAWPAAERRSLHFFRGRVLDVGCGAGRVALHLQQAGFDVVGLDASPLAARAARTLGVKKVWRRSLEDLDSRIAEFDTVVLFGNNFGLFGTPDRARRLLTEWSRHAKPSTRIFAESTSAYFGGAPAMNRSYYRRNVERGIAPGQARLRFHYGDGVGAWFDWLYVTPREMRLILRGTGWHQARLFRSRLSEPYVAMLETD